MIKKVLMVIGLLATGLCHAYNIHELNDESFSQIMANENRCVKGFSEEKIYLNPDKIHATENGIFVNLNDVDFVCIPILHSDNQGCYISNSQELALSLDYHKYCSECGKQYIYACTNPKCPKNQKTPPPPAPKDSKSKNR
jgi:NADH pyrophosphatase NudC (nudix superfamily)